jgi:protein-disulfide isomerase
MIPPRAALLACLLGAACVKNRPPPEMASLEARVSQLEQMLAKREDALAFLDSAYEQRLESEAKPQPGKVYGVDIQPDLALGQVIGSPQAPVTIVKAWDFACPYCYRTSSILEELVAEYAGKVRVVFKHMIVHPQQVAVAHLAACAAAKQGKFPQFYHAFWQEAFAPYMEQHDASLLGEQAVMRIAASVGLDVDRVKADMPACQSVVLADETELRKFRVDGTPSFFINGEFIGGGIPKEAFKQHIDQKLAIAARSGVPAADYYEKEIRGKGEKSVERPKREAAPAAKPGR